MRSALHPLALALTLTLPLTAAAGAPAVPAEGDAALLDVRLEAAAGRFEGLLALDRPDAAPAFAMWGEAAPGLAHAPDVAYPWASVSKAVTAVAVMALVERGELSLDARLADLLPAFKHQPAESVTVRQLLAHQSGIPSVMHAGQGLDAQLDPSTWPVPVAPGELVEAVVGLPLQFEPGTRYAYSNSNYLILGQLIEQASGQDYDVAIHRLAFAPAGLDGGVDWGDDVAGVEDAFGREWTGLDGDRRDAVRIHPSRSGAAGALRATPMAMLAWAEALAAGRILRPETLAQMWGEGLPTRRAGERMALGWLVRDTAAGPLVLHDGSLPGINAVLAIRPAAGEAALGVLSPTLPLDQLSRSEDYLRERVVGLLAGERPADAPQGALHASPDVSGRYTHADGIAVTMAPADGAWSVAVEGASPFLLPQAFALADARSARAVEAMVAWSRGGDAAMRPFFADDLREAVPAGALDGQWQAWVAALGEPAPARAWRRSADGRIVTVHQPFARGAVNLAIVLDADARIEGLRIVSQGPTPPMAPVRAWATRDGRLWIDGYRLGQPSVWLDPRREGERTVALAVGDGEGERPLLVRAPDGGR